MSSIKMNFLFLFLLPLVCGESIVETNTGPVRGVSLADKEIEAFLGIPYAEPPVGPLRFRKPVPKAPWNETYNATELPPACVQAFSNEFRFFAGGDIKMTEDCLHLNLWVPGGDSNPKTVMVFIHGGAFMSGSSNMKIYDGAALAEYGDVIVASMNYRVGTLGYFSAFTEDAPGSLGMYDQVMAMQWLKDNVEKFGGDPDNIVIFGESAGSFSVSLHLISPLSKNLFKRAILQSGSSISPMYSGNNGHLYAGSAMAATLLGCADNAESLKVNATDVVECMKNLPPEKFVEADLTVLKSAGMLIPRVGDDFLPASPADLYRTGKFKDGEILIGATRDEGSILLTFMKSEIFGLLGEKVNASTFNETSAKAIVLPLLGLQSSNDITHSYFKRVQGKSRYTFLDATNELLGDFFITCGAVFQADFQSLKNQPVYFYLFDYRPKSSPFAEWMGVSHFLEVPYVFGNPLHNQVFSEFEEELSNDMMNMWVSFAKTGNPSVAKGLKWPRYSYSDPKYLIISQKDKLGVRPDNYRCEAWRQLFQSTVEDEISQKYVD